MRSAAAATSRGRTWASRRAVGRLMGRGRSHGSGAGDVKGTGGAQPGAGAGAGEGDCSCVYTTGRPGPVRARPNPKAAARPIRQPREVNDIAFPPQPPLSAPLDGAHRVA